MGSEESVLCAMLSSLAYHRDVWCYWIVEGALLDVLRDKVALVLHHIQCQSLVVVTKIIFGQCAATFYEERGREGERGRGGREGGREG